MTKELSAQRPPYLMIAVLFIGAFISFLNNTLMNVALPTIMQDFQISYATVQWLSNGYMLVSGVLIPASAFFITRFNTKPLFVVATSIFTLGTLLAAFSPNFGTLLAGRMVQAAGSSVMAPLLMNVMLVSFPIEKRGTAMGFFGLIMMAAPAIGPTLSGYIVEHYNWRILFTMILPFAVISVLLGLWKLENVIPTKKKSLDYFSIVLSTIGFGSLLYGFSTAGNKGWSDPVIITTIIIGIIGIVLFVLRQLKLESPFLSMEIFKAPSYTLSAIFSSVLGMGLTGGMILTPAYLQSVRHIEPMESGLMMLPGALVMAAMSPITGRLFDKFGPRVLAIIGMSIMTVTTYLLSHLEIDTSIIYIISVYTVRTIGISLVMMPVMTNGLNSLAPRLNPHGTAANNTIQQIAGSIGTAVLIAVMNTKATSVGEKMAAEAMQAGTFSEEVMASITQQALLEGIELAFFVATCFTLIPLLLSFFLKRVTQPQIK
ncbi:MULTISPECIES: DHA2 family efflux MFS transporter permease subunit [Ureibacillus]|jgi:EmrB/QacA subfamily drug resistance transporter|uniref:EmrB/QacA subfamily drug resistance transporter n=1 Tax=Ureibacillus thermosphaericus TaxID=51173 RepID=A0A840PWV4_URETH|nr:DHA2 family efflux MFS transporter permease subunit [Ureibacillus thermosphaericus]MBB5149182.1 EmrB/QacA subfamily drug resistance transporter [Ureibacillus thermosphaericus]NKZ31943.1 DHA2 family efflux MFS transporter permease subunit [Ureibacillus thermosphaericus]